MNKNFWRGVGGLMTFGMALGTTLPAFAVGLTYSGSNLWKEPGGSIGIAGTPLTTIKVTIGGTSESKPHASDACKVMGIHFSTTGGVTAPTSVNINGTATDLSTAAQSSKKWTCDAATGTLSANGSAAVPGTVSPIVKVLGTTGVSYYIYQPSALTDYVVQYTGNVSKSVRINSCGYGLIRNTAAQQLSSTTTITIPGGTATAVSAITAAPGSPRCVKGTSSALVPSGWTP